LNLVIPGMLKMQFAIWILPKLMAVVFWLNLLVEEREDVSLVVKKGTGLEIVEMEIGEIDAQIEEVPEDVSIVAN